MRELILRHAHAARKHGSFTSSTLAAAQRNRVSTSHLQHIRFKSAQSLSPSPSPPRPPTPPAPASSPVPELTQQSERRYGKATPPAPPREELPPLGTGLEPNIDAGRDLAVRGLVRDLASTRPPPLELPEPPHPHAWPRKGNWDPKRWDFKYMFALGKAYGKFYWAGVKQLYANVKLMFRINSALSGTFPDAAARYGVVPEGISYNDYQLMVRTKRDMRKSIPFLLVLAICGEFTPLVILVLGSRVVPGTCVIPKQVIQDRKNMLERDDTYMTEVARLLRTSGGDWGNIRTDRKKLIALHNLIAYQAGLTPFKTPLPIVGGLYWQLRTQKNLARHCDDLLSTAVLVQREGGWSYKSPQDMWEWGNKYGLYRLREYTRQAMARDEDPVSEKMKATMLPYFEAEVKNILGEDFSRIPRKSHCTLALNSPLYHRSDTDRRRAQIEKLAEEQK